MPRIFSKYRVYAYNFIDENKVGPQYWRDVGTVEAYYEANMDLVSVSPIFNLYDKSWPIRTWQHQYPPVKTVFADPGRMGVSMDSMVGGGSSHSGGRVNRLPCSVMTCGPTATPRSRDSILFNHVTIGRHARVRNAIIDRHVTIPERAEIGYDVEADRQRYHVSEGGIVVVVREESMIEEPE